MFERLFLAFVLLVSALSPISANAVDDFSCLNFKVINEKGLWSLSEGPEVTTAVVTWSVKDPGNCVIGNPTGAWITGNQIEVNWVSVNYIRGKFYGTLSSARSGENYVVVMKLDIPNTWISSVANTPGTWGGVEMSQQFYYQIGGGGGLHTYMDLEAKASSSKTQSKTLRAEIAAADLWGLVLSNRQKLVRDDCIPESTSNLYSKSSVTPEIKVVTAGPRPKISIEISDPSNCVFLIYTPSIGTSIKENSVLNPFWSLKGAAHWSNLVSATPNLIQVSANVFGEKRDRSIWPDGFQIQRDAVPIISTSSLSLVDNKIIINSELDLTQLNKSSNVNSEAQIVIGVYSRVNKISSGSSSPGGWRVTWVSSNTFRLGYSRGGATPTGVFNEYQVASVKIPIIDLLEDRTTRENAKLEAEAKAKVAAELKARQEAEARAAAELKAKQEEEAKAAADKAAATKKVTITCVKGKTSKKVTAVNPKCPAGYKKK